jgi:hypothetical protein
MAIKLGSSDIAKVYLGATEVDKIYLGATEVYSAASLLLDTYTGAEFANSFRALRTAYSGNDIRARESSGSTEQDEGFVSGVLDTASLLTFIGANDGLLPIIYDQSGNGNNFAQTTAANQLKIVDAGALVTSNSLAATQGSTSTGGQTSSIAFSGMSEFWFFDVIDVSSTAGTQLLYEASTATGSFIIYINGGNLLVHNRISGGNLLAYYNISTGRQLLSTRLISGVGVASYSEVYINGVEISAFLTSGAGNSAFTDQVLDVGARGGSSLGFTGKRQESIMYPTDQSANRVGIETNINAYYGIY